MSDQFSVLRQFSTDSEPALMPPALVAELLAEYDRLHALLNADPQVVPTRDDSLFAIEHWAIKFLADSLGKTLADAPNWMAIEVRHPDHGPLVVTVRRKNGKSPEEMLRAVREELDALKAEREVGA